MAVENQFARPDSENNKKSIPNKRTAKFTQSSKNLSTATAKTESPVEIRNFSHSKKIWSGSPPNYGPGVIKLTL